MNAHDLELAARAASSAAFHANPSNPKTCDDYRYHFSAYQCPCEGQWREHLLQPKHKPVDRVTSDDIRSAREKASREGNSLMVTICDFALTVDPDDMEERSQYWAEKPNRKPGGPL